MKTQQNTAKTKCSDMNSKNKPSESNKSENVINKKKRYRGKKKKNKNENKPVIIVPKLKDLQKENISSNWKNLLLTLPSDPPSSKSKPSTHQKESNFKKKPEKKPTKEKVAAAPEIWFDDVDEMLLEPQPVEGAVDAATAAEQALVKDKSFKGLTKVIGMDCEMVGIGRDGEDSILARVSIVNHFGHQLYDTFVSNTETVTDYRTKVSGVRPQDLRGAPDFKSVQTKVADILKGRLLVGHAIHHDLKVLYLDHPRKLIRDTSKYKPFRAAFGGKTPGLKRLSERFLGVQVQSGEHSSVQDAQAAVRLYTLVRKEWEQTIKLKQVGKFHNKKPGSGTLNARKLSGHTQQAKLNNKSDELVNLQKDLSTAGTKLYVDSDSE